MGSVIDQKNRELAANAQRHAPQELADAYKTGRQEALSEAIKWAEKSARLQVGEDEVAREAYHRMADALSEMKNGPSPQG
jgi:hypothetical protein